MHWQRPAMLNRCGNHKPASWLPSGAQESSAQAARPHRSLTDGLRELAEDRAGTTFQSQRHVPAERRCVRSPRSRDVEREEFRSDEQEGTRRPASRSEPRASFLRQLPRPAQGGLLSIVALCRIPSTGFRRRVPGRDASTRRDGVPLHKERKEWQNRVSHEWSDHSA